MMKFNKQLVSLADFMNLMDGDIQWFHIKVEIAGPDFLDYGFFCK